MQRASQAVFDFWYKVMVLRLCERHQLNMAPCSCFGSLVYSYYGICKSCGCLRLRFGDKTDYQLSQRADGFRGGIGMWENLNGVSLTHISYAQGCYLQQCGLTKPWPGSGTINFCSYRLQPSIGTWSPANESREQAEIGKTSRYPWRASVRVHC